MRLLQRIATNSPILKIRSHQRLSVFACVSVGGRPSTIWRWGSGGMEMVAELPVHSFQLGSTPLELLHRATHGLTQIINAIVDVAFHPQSPICSFLLGQRKICSYDVITGKLIRELRFGDLDHGLEEDGERLRFGDLSYCAVTYSSCGTLLAATPFEGYRTKVFRASDLHPLGDYFGGNLCFAVHPKSDLVATVRNDQGGAVIRFVRLSIPFAGSKGEGGWIEPRARVNDEEDVWGWSPELCNVAGMAFDHAGEFLAVVGGFPDVNETVDLEVYAFPTLRSVYKWVIQLGDSRDTDWLPSGLAVERVVFHPRSNRLLVPLPSGNIAEIDFLGRGEVSQWKAHAASIRTLDICQTADILITGDLTGELAVWQFD